MDAIKTLLVHQYSLVQDARKVLFEFLASISEEDFLRTSEHVGNGGCIKNLLIHTCNSYAGWLSHFAFGRPFNKVAYDSINQLSSCAEYFSKVDVMVEEFIHSFENRYEQSITGTIANGTRTVTST